MQRDKHAGCRGGVSKQQSEEQPMRRSACSHQSLASWTDRVQAVIEAAPMLLGPAAPQTAAWQAMLAPGIGHKRLLSAWGHCHLPCVTSGQHVTACWK